MHADPLKVKIELHTAICDVNTTLVGQSSVLNFFLEARLFMWHLKQMLQFLSYSPEQNILDVLKISM